MNVLYCALVYTMFTLEFMADLHALSVCLCTIIGSLKYKTNCNVLNGIIIVIILSIANRLHCECH